jgi:hypothetical protein
MITGNIAAFTRVYQDAGGLDTPNKLAHPVKTGWRGKETALCCIS